MGGFFGISSKKECLVDVFFGTDYHSHLGTHCGGIAAYDKKIGLQRVIHNIQNSPFRTKFERVFEEMRGKSAVGCISDADPQPLLVRSRLGTFAICTVGMVSNTEELIRNYMEVGGHFNTMTSGVVNTTELVAALIGRHQSFAEGIRFVQSVIEGALSIMILCEGGEIIVSRDRLGRLPVLIGKNEDGYAITFESFAYEKLGYVTERELGPGEILSVKPDGLTQLSPPGEEMRVCAFLWTYFGYPTSTYEGVNVETMRYRSGSILAEADQKEGSAQGVDYVGGMPDSGTPYAIGYAGKSNIPFARPFIKYTPTWPRSFTPPKQADRAKIAKMKQVPVRDLIVDKNLLFVDDSIVRGTQLRETVEFLYDSGAASVHVRSACPPMMYPCKYLNFARSNGDMDLIARRTIVELEGEEGIEHLAEYSDGSTERGKKMRAAICEKLHLASLEYQTLEGVFRAIGLPECKLCTYCWNGKE